MAKPVRTVVIEKYPGASAHLLYVTMPDSLVSDVQAIEGITDISGKLSNGSRRVGVDLRYSLDDVANDIQRIADDYDNAKNLLDS